MCLTFCWWISREFPKVFMNLTFGLKNVRCCENERTGMSPNNEDEDT